MHIIFIISISIFVFSDQGTTLQLVHPVESICINYVNRKKIKIDTLYVYYKILSAKALGEEFETVASSRANPELSYTMLKITKSRSILKRSVYKR